MIDQMLGPYRVLEKLGAGGMGEVYRARDTRLGRDVALKILPESVTRDPERVARFRREAQVLAALNHPRIAAIYGLEDVGEVCLVLEFVDGGTLRDRLARGPLAIDEALAIARQVAEALEAAHEKGIVHRDLKPGNIGLTQDGEVKVLDFGLAKALAPGDGGLSGAGAGLPSSDAANSPTFTSPAIATMAGVILGTAAYMSPEQARGRAADKRSDIWAFGCVLFEMLTGRGPFDPPRDAGANVTETLAAVLKSNPDWNALPAALPPAIRSLVEGCLKKDRRERIGDISTAIFLLKQPAAAPSTAPARPSSAARVRSRAGFVMAGIAIGAVAAAAGLWTLRPRPPVSVTRFSIPLSQGESLMPARQAVVVSPDGTGVAYAAAGHLYVRRMDALEPKAILGLEGVQNPAFSPDGRSLAFWSDGKIRRIDLTGGAPVPICDAAPSPSAIVWDTVGILYGQPGTGVLKVQPDGGKPEVIVRLTDSDGLAHGPQLLPDGRTLLFTLAPGRAVMADRWDRAQIVVQSLDTGQRQTLIEAGTDARYVPTGHIVYMVGGILYAVAFDASARALKGGPIPIVEGVRRTSSASSGAGQFAFSASGTLAYVPGPISAGQLDLAVFDRKGGAERLKLAPGSYLFPRVSPDGRRLAFEASDGKGEYIAIYDLSGASSVRRLTFGGNNRFPIWSADSRHVAFQSDRDGDLAVFRQPADGGTAERLTKPEPGTSHVPESWSPTGEAFLFSATRGLETTLWVYSIRDRQARPFGDVKSILYPTHAVFAPDGRWVAYQVGEAGAGEATTYVEPVPPNGTKYQIARGGRPAWSRDGKALFFVPGPGQFRVVNVRTQPSFSFTEPTAVPRGFGVADPVGPRPYDPLPDGRWIGTGTVGSAQNGFPVQTEIRVVLNWFEELVARAPVK